MIKIKKTNQNNLRNYEHFQFQTEFKDLVELFTPEALGVGTLFEKYLLLYAQEGGCLRKIEKSATTEELENADHARDVTFRGFADTVKTALKHFNEDTRTAARRIEIVFHTYGNLARRIYDAETASIYKLLQELRNNYMPEMELLGITPWADQLDAENQAFEQLMQNRYSEQNQKTDLRTKEVRLEIDRIYHSITERIDALGVINGTEAYEPFVHQLNVLIEHYTYILAQRKRISEAKASSPQPSPKERE